MTAADASSVRVAWPSSRDNVAVAGYGVFLNGKTVGATPETRYTFGGLACGTGYLVGVDVYDAAGNRSQPTSTTVSTSACRDLSPPTVPTAIRLAASTETSVVLSWQASSDNIGVVGYGLYVGGFRVGSTSEPAATLTSLSCGRSYEVGIDAVDAAGNRSARASSYFSTSPCPGDKTAPSQPNKLAVGAATTSSITLSWAASTDNTGVTGYGLYRGSSRVELGDAADGDVQWPACGTAYQLGVDAVDAAGNRSAVASVSASTQPCVSTPPAERVVEQPEDRGFVPRGTVWRVTVTPEPDEVDFWASDRRHRDRHVGAVRGHAGSGAGRLQARVLLSHRRRAEVRDDRIRRRGRDRRPHHRGRQSPRRRRATRSARPFRIVARRVGRGHECQRGMVCLDRQHCCHGLRPLSWLEPRRYDDPDHRNVQWPHVRHHLSARGRCGRRGGQPFGGRDRVGVHAAVRPVGRYGRPVDAQHPARRHCCGDEPEHVVVGLHRQRWRRGVRGVPWLEPGGYHWPNGGHLHQSVCGTAYQVGVDAYDTAGNRSSRADMTATTSACPDIDPPSTPTDVVVGTRTATSIALSWSRSTDDVGTVGYGVYRGGSRVSTTAGTTGIVTGLTCGTNYTLGVDAYDAAGNRSTQAIVMVATLGCADTQPPTTPTNVTASSVTQTSLNVGWAASADNVGVTGYSVYRDGSLLGQTNNLLYSVGGLSCGTTSTFAVAALDAAGNVSLGRGSVTVATSACSPVTPTGSGVYLSPTGSDAASCTSSAPCKSLQRGFAVAQAGQTVSLAPGSYGSGSLTNAHKAVTFSGSGSFSNISLQCTTGITLSGLNSVHLGIYAGNDSLTIKGGRFGYGTYQTNNENDPVVIGDAAGDCSNGNLSEGVVLDGINVGGYLFPNGNHGTAHPDCLQFYGGSDGVTLRNSTFDGCDDSFIGAFPDFGVIRNVLIENNTFRNLDDDVTYFASQWGQSGHPFAASSSPGAATMSRRIRGSEPSAGTCWLRTTASGRGRDPITASSTPTTGAPCGATTRSSARTARREAQEDELTSAASAAMLKCALVE